MSTLLLKAPPRRAGAVVAAAADLAEPVEAVEESAGEMRVRFPVLVIEGMPTSDGRFIEPGALTPRALPLSLLAQAEASHGGDDPGPAVVIGRLDSMERRPGPEVTSRRTGEPFPEGTFVWSAEGVIDANHPVADLVRRGFLRGVSVDLAGMDYEIVGDDGAPMADGDWGSGGRLITHAAELAAATLVPVPAFGDAYGELADEAEPPAPVAPEDLPEGLLASAVPAWRSPEVGDPVAAIVAAADEGMPVRIPPDSVEQLTAVIDTGAERDAAELATAIVEHIAQQWALDEPVTEDELPADEAVVAAAGEDQGGFPEDEQPCQYGPESAVESLVFREGDAYVPVCEEHRQQALDELAAAGEEVAETVTIGVPEEGAPVEPIVAAAGEPHTGGMIALIPADPGALVVDGGDPAEQLHLTLAYLGDDVTGMDEEVRAALLADVEAQAATLPRVEAEVMGHAAFNPTGANDREPCAVYLVSGPGLPEVKAAFAGHDVSEHPVFLPHVTAAYGLEPSALNFVGPVVFDRLRVALGEDVHDFPLGAPAAEESGGQDFAASDGAHGEGGSLGPGPGEYGEPHVYARDPQSGAGNCMCGAPPDDPIHVGSPLAPGGGEVNLVDGEDTGIPDAPQPCAMGDHPAVRSLLFGGGQYVAVCDEHEQEARDEIAARGDEVTDVVEIEQPEPGVTEETPE